MENKILSSIVDWKDFENFVCDLYKNDLNLKTQHNVTLIGKSGAKRQLDVLVKSKIQFHEISVAIECKYWKDKVDRTIVDGVASAIDDLNISKGVIFTTVGFEQGAESYAKFKNIDIFVVRDLSDSEWGLPGRKIEFYLHFYTYQIGRMSFPNATIFPIVKNLPPNINLDFTFGKDIPLDDSLFLFSVNSGVKGPHLFTLLIEQVRKIIKGIGQQIGLINGGLEGSEMLIASDVTLDLSEFDFREIRKEFGVINFNLLKFPLSIKISQTKMNIDRGEKYSLALVVEDFISSRRTLITKSGITTQVSIRQLEESNIKNTDEILKNNSLFQVVCEPFVTFELSGKEIKRATNPILIKLL